MTVPAQSRISKRLWLVIVAVGRYADPAVPELPGVLGDANRLADVLRRQADAPIADVKVLFNEQATREAILDALREVAREALAGDQVLIWFGGHGIEKLGGDSPMPDGMTRYLLPADATTDTIEAIGISTRQLTEELARLRAAEVVVVLDCCHGGGLAGLFWPDLAALVHGAKSRHVIAAARPHQGALDNCSFTHSFCDALEGQIPSLVADGVVPSGAAFQHAQRRLRDLARLQHHRQEAIECKVAGDAIALTRPVAVNPATGKTWRPLVCSPLQPAPHFRGRETLRADLMKWIRSPSSPDRVVSLVAIGGTGKTALAERVLHDLGEPPAGLLCWSFDEDPRTEGFLRAACEYFTGEAPAGAGGLLERLQTALSGEVPHLLVLDGLECVQAEGTPGRARGELEDPLIRRLLRWLAAGVGTRTRALVTSRFPLVDLESWKSVGHREVRLEDLEPEAARGVLRSWGVRGDDATLDGLTRPLHYHALSVAVLGSYLGKLWGGDPTRAPTFDRDEMALADPKAARLSRILTSYAEKLPDAERDLLARLSAFPRGVTIEFLGFLVEAGGQIAGALAGCQQGRLMRLLERLGDLGLLFPSEQEQKQKATFTAHPFVRDYFRGLLGTVRSEDVHEVVRKQLAPSLESGRGRLPTDPVVLDRFQALIEHTCLAGKPHEAFGLYLTGMGSYRHLSRFLGDNSRGLRIVSFFSHDGTVGGLDPALDDQERWDLLTDWGLYAKNLGDLATARRAFELALPTSSAWRNATTLENLTNVALLEGRFPDGKETAQQAWDVSGNLTSGAYVARALANLGDVLGAAEWFSKQPLPPGEGMWEAEFELMRGNVVLARTLALTQREALNDHSDRRFVALYDALLGRLALPAECPEAKFLLGRSRSFGRQSGEIQVQLRCYHLAAEIARTEAAHDLARSEAEAGILLADTHGYGHHAIELRLALARIHLDADDAAAALKRAREALERSCHPECQYAWGEADAQHLCGVAHARLGDVPEARRHLTAALARRSRLTHPGTAETRAELDRLGA